MADAMLLYIVGRGGEGIHVHTHTHTYISIAVSRRMKKDTEALQVSVGNAMKEAR